MDIKVVTRTVRVQACSDVGLLIKFLLESSNSPAIALTEGSFHATTEAGREATMYLDNISPEDLDAFKNLLLGMKRPNELAWLFVEDNWRKVTQELVNQLIPQTR
jgi:hypothetical protein